MIVKLSRIVFIVLSMVSILSTGCAPPVPGHQSETAEDGSPVLTAEDSSASRLPASARDLKRLSWEVGPEIYFYKYTEEDFMELEGAAFGLNAGFTLRNWLPASPEQSYEAMDLAFYKLMLRGEGRFAFGDGKYEGGVGSTPLVTDNVDDRMFEVRLLVGPDFPGETTLITLFTGVAYRYLHNDTRTGAVDPIAYERESEYVYLPLGVETTTQLGGGWSGGISGEVDFFLWGNQRSHISSSSDQPVDNYQPRGYGLRGSARLVKKGDKVDLIIEPFIRYWKINESEISDGILEPTNSTVEAGLRVSLGF